MARIATLTVNLAVEDAGRLVVSESPGPDRWAADVLKVEQTTISSGVAAASFSIPSGADCLILITTNPMALITLAQTSGASGEVLILGGSKQRVAVIPLAWTGTLYLVTQVGSAGGATTLIWL